jgi:hypothetical protein
MAARHSFQLVGFGQTLQQHVGINDSSLADQESLHFESRRIRKGSSGEKPLALRIIPASRSCSLGPPKEKEAENYAVYAVKDGYENPKRGISELASLVSTPWTHKLFIYNRTVSFQAGRRGFEPRLPLHFQQVTGLSRCPLRRSYCASRIPRGPQVHFRELREPPDERLLEHPSLPVGLVGAGFAPPWQRLSNKRP